MSQRKDILDNIRNTVCRTFYKNEEDATQFYSDMMTRKKEHSFQGFINVAKQMK